jgi:creatinine amidohydrolase
VEEGHFWEELTENGALGDAREASEELGREIIEVALDRLTEFLRRFMAT